MTLDQFKTDLLRRFPFRPGINYMAVDAHGAVCQYETKPWPGWVVSFWVAEYNSQFIDKVLLPDGIDWCDTLISRAETK